MKKLILILVMTFAITWMTTPVFAEESPPTESGSYFENKVAPYLAAGGAAGVTALTSFLGFLRTNRKKAADAAKTLNEAVDGMQKKVDTATTIVDSGIATIAKFQVDMTAKVSDVSTDVKTFTASADKALLEMKTATEKSTAEINGMKADMIAIKEDQTRTMKAILIGFCKNPELVKNGYADLIAKLWKGEPIDEKTTPSQSETTTP